MGASKDLALSWATIYTLTGDVSLPKAEGAECANHKPTFHFVFPGILLRSILMVRRLRSSSRW